nr:hypothetical protein [Tanacetum cinerariifolium]
MSASESAFAEEPVQTTSGPTYELMRGSCTSLTELEYHLEEPLPLIPDNRGHRVIPFEHFINNDLEYLRGGASSRKYTTSITKTKAADYGHIKWIEDLVPREMWIQQPIDYNKHALWGVSHLGRKRKQFYGNLHKALVESYEADKIILDTYGERVILKRRRDDDDDDEGEGPSAGSDRGSKRRREGKEPESARAPLEPATRSTGRSTTGSKSWQASASESAFAKEPHPEWFSQPKKPPTPDRDWNKTLPAIQGSAQTWISKLAKQADSLSSFNELLDTPIDFSNFIMNRLGVDTLTPELLARPTYELMKGSCKSLTELEYHLEEVYKAMTDQLDWINPEGQQYPHNLLHPLLLILDNQGRRVIPFAHFINNDLEYLRGGAYSRKYTTFVTKTKATYYGHIKWIEYLVPRTMWIQEPINYDKHALWGVSHWGRKRQQFYGMFIRSIVIQRRVEDLQLGVESYQKRLNLTKPDSYRSDLKRREADGTLNDVRNALDDRLKGIRMQYLPQTLWRKGDKDRAAAMIQAIDKMLKTRRIMRSLERFVEGRLYEGDFRMLQRTI